MGGGCPAAAPARLTTPRACPWAGRNRGRVSPRMKRKMKNTATMMKRPPSVMVPVARRSITFTRAMRVLDSCARGRMLGGAGAVGAAAARIPSISRICPRRAVLLDLGQLLLHDLCGEGKVAVLHHDLLSLLAEDELYVFPDDGVERLAGRAVDVDVEEARERILAARHVAVSAVEGRAALLFPELDRSHAGGPVPDAAVPDAEAVLGHALHDRRRSGLLLHGVLVVAVGERVLLEEPVGARCGVAAVESDGSVGPISGQAELAPGLDVGLVASLAGLREYRVDLGEGQLLEGVVLVHPDGERVVGGAELAGLVAVLLL